MTRMRGDVTGGSTGHLKPVEPPVEVSNDQPIQILFLPPFWGCVYFLSVTRMHLCISSLFKNSNASLRANTTACFQFLWFYRSKYSLKLYDRSRPGPESSQNLQDAAAQHLWNVTIPSAAILAGCHPAVTSLSCEAVISVSSDICWMPSSGDVTFKVRTWACTSHNTTSPSCQRAEGLHRHWMCGAEPERKRFRERHNQRVSILAWKHLDRNAQCTSGCRSTCILVVIQVNLCFRGTSSSWTYNNSLELTWKGKTKVAFGSRLLGCFSQHQQLVAAMCDIELVPNSLHVLFNKSYQRSATYLLFMDMKHS